MCQMAHNEIYMQCIYIWCSSKYTVHYAQRPTCRTFTDVVVDFMSCSVYCVISVMALCVYKVTTWHGLLPAYDMLLCFMVCVRMHNQIHNIYHDISHYITCVITYIVANITQSSYYHSHHIEHMYGMRQ